MNIFIKKFNKYHDDEIFSFYASCLVVQGYNLAAIYDLQGNKFFHVPKDLLKTISNGNLVGLGKQLAQLTEHDALIFRQYLDYLLIERLGFICKADDLYRFPPISMDWHHFSKITNATILFSNSISLIKIFKKLVDLGCYHFVVYIESLSSLELFYEINSFLNSVPVKSISVRINHHSFQIIELSKILENSIVIESVIIYNTSNEINSGKVFLKKGTMDLKKRRPESVSSFRCNINLYTESISFNTYFNRKVHVTKLGEIKNSKETKVSFGNIFDSKIKLKKIISKAEFQKYWLVHKEICDVCKDCEFRHMCVDNRIPHQRKDGSWYHKEECYYNPYINKWQGEDGYKSLEECGIKSDITGFSIDYKKIEKINRKNRENEV